MKRVEDMVRRYEMIVAVCKNLFIPFDEAVDINDETLQLLCEEIQEYRVPDHLGVLRKRLE